MTDSRIVRLLELWCQAQAAGQPTTAELLCADQPELLSLLLDEIAALQLPPTRDGLISLLTPQSQASVASVAVRSQLGGYRLERLLGQGGMGSVYLAQDDGLGRKVALKTMRPEIAAQPAARERFLREARAAAAVEDDHVISIWQVGEDFGIPFIAMPFLQGEALSDRLKREKILPLPLILKIGSEVALGLAAAHEHGLVHRDIKPANIWLEGDDRTGEITVRRVKILDFGLAHVAEDRGQLTVSGAVLGTPQYMSPEQGRGGTVDHRSDLFSLGVLLYRMTTGLLPFTGSSTMAILTALATREPPPPITLNPQIPRALSSLIGELMEKVPVNRPDSALAVAEWLRSIAGTINVHQDRRSRIGLAIGLAMVGLSASAAAVAFWPEPRVEIVAPVPEKLPETVPEVVVHNSPVGIPEIITPEIVPEKQLLTWILKHQGKATVAIAGNEYAVLDLSDIPAGHFDIVRIDFNDSREVRDDDLAQFADLPQLRSLLLARCPLTANGLPRLATYRKLIELDLTGQAIPHQLLPELSTVRRLVLQNCPLDVKAIRRLAGSEAVYLDLSSTGIDDDGLAALDSLKSLRELVLRHTPKLSAPAVAASRRRHPDCRIDRGEVPADREWAALEFTFAQQGKVSISRGIEPAQFVSSAEECLGPFALTGLTLPNLPENTPLTTLNNLPNLRNLWLSGMAVNNQSIKELHHLPRLIELTLSRTEIGDEGIAHLSSLTSLQRLFIIEGNFGDTGAQSLMNLIRLEELNLVQTNITDAGLAKLATLKQLRNLSMSGSPIGDGVVRSLFGMKLERLSLNQTQVTGVGLERLTDPAGLRQLELANTPLAAGTTAKIARFTHLTKLNLRATPLTDADLKPLYALKELQQLSLDDIRFSEAAIKELREALPACRVTNLVKGK